MAAGLRPIPGEDLSIRTGGQAALVPEVGLEPTRRATATDFESASSTSSDTLARGRIGRIKHLSGRSDPARYPARQAAAVLDSGRNSGSSASTTCLPWPEHSPTPRNPSTNPATPHLGTAPPSADRQLPCSRSIRLAQAPLTPSPAALSTAGHARARLLRLSPAREPGSARSALAPRCWQ